MSTLISSAVGNKKVAAPKQGARRRQPPPPSAAAAKAAAPASAPSTQTDAAPPSSALPATQPSSVPPTLDAEGSRAPPSPQPVEQVIQRPTIPSPTLQSRTRDSEASESGPALPRRINEPDSADNDGRRSSEDARPASSGKRQRDTAPEPQNIQPAKRTKKSSARSNATVQTAAQDEAPSTSQRATTSGKQTRLGRAHLRGDTTAAAASAADTMNSVDTAAGKKPRAGRKKKRKSDDPTAETPVADNEAEAAARQPISDQATAKRKKQVRRRKKTQVDEAPEQQREEISANAEEVDENDSSESDPELHEIDPNTVTMWEVGGSKKYGRTSEREKKMAEIDWAEVARKRREAADRALLGNPDPTTRSEAVVETIEGPSGVAEPPNDPTAQSPAANANISGVQFHLVNGQIVEDESTLTIDRQAQAEAEAAQTGEQLIEEEVDLTARVNRTTHLNDRRREATDRVPMWRSKSDPWNEEETDRFYEALKMFGTDFFIISKMFAPKTRRQIKTKFVREERLDPERINAALLGKQSKPMDLAHYAREVGTDVSEYTKYESVKQAEEMIRLSLADKEEELRNTIREEERLEEARKKEQQERENARKKGQAKKAKTRSTAAGRKKKKEGEGEATMDAGEIMKDALAGAEG